MTPNARSDAVIAAWLEEGPPDLTATERSAIADAAELVAQRRSILPMRLPAERRLLILAAGIVVVVVASSSLLPAFRQLPMSGGPSPSAIVTPAASPATSPVAPSAIACQIEPPNRQVEWSGRVRTDLAGMPVVCSSAGDDGQWSRTDPRDTAVEGIDIVEILARGRESGQPQWTIELSAFPPAAATLDRAETVIEYGLVFETTGDGVADFVAGINNDAPVRGEHRVWVTRLATNETDERVGGPYGYPVEFAYPDELPAQTEPSMWRPRMMFMFLSGSTPWIGTDIGPVTVRYYAWASVMSGTEMVAWDYAPDYGWLIGG